MLNVFDNQLNVVYLLDIYEFDFINFYVCGKIDIGGNFQNLMVFFYVLNVVNQYVNFLVIFKFGGLVLDICLILGRIGQDLYSLFSGEGFCGEEGVGQVIDLLIIIVYLVKNF